MIEVKYQDGRVCDGRDVGVDLAIRECEGNISHWRPLIAKEQSLESECALSPNFVDRPVYTQAMADAGELPSVGMECVMNNKNLG